VDFGPCACGVKSPSIRDNVVRYSDLEGDDKISCSGTVDAYVREVPRLLPMPTCNKHRNQSLRLFRGANQFLNRPEGTGQGDKRLQRFVHWMSDEAAVSAGML